MKPVRRADSASQSCSCTSCIYKSESEQTSIRKYIAHGSRIDRLYYGKYIPLRERKLLNKLVRTRAVYDDLRARLISDSTLSLEKNADLRPGKHHRVIKALDSEKSGAILELVDIIDKGAALGPRKLSECCSCCSCSSKSKFLDKIKKEPRQKKPYAFARTYEEYGRTQTEQTGMGEGVYDRTYEREYGKMIPGRLEERYNKRGVRFKAKHIRSDPCTCTFKFSGIIKKHSRAMFRRIRPLPLEQPFFGIEEQYINEKAKKNKLVTKSFQKYKELQDKLEQDFKKLNESRANIKENLQLHAKKSLKQVKQLKHKLKHQFESGVRKSMQAAKNINPKHKTFEPVEYPEFENTFKIKKDSIVKFKDYLKKKEMMKDWECDLECEPDKCVPEQCFKIIKLRRLHKRNHQQARKNIATYELINREKNVGGPPISRSSSGVQTGNFGVTTATYIKKQKPILRHEGKNRLMKKHLVFKSEKVKNVGLKKDNKKVVENSETSLMPTTTTLEEGPPQKRHIHKKDETFKEKELRLAKRGNTNSRGRQAVRIKSSFSFDIEFYKNPPNLKTSRPSQPSGIHMHAPRRKHKKIHRRRMGPPHVALKPSLESSQRTPEKFKPKLHQTDKYSKASITSQGPLLPDISLCECDKHLSNVNTNTDYKTKSVSSLTSRSSSAKSDKYISKKVKQKERLSQVSLLPARVDTLTSGIKESYSHHNQAVRIGSTFSFNVEFYKRNNENKLKPPLIKKKLKQTHIKNRYVTRKLVQVKGTSAKAYDQAKTTLRRCFCTMKLQGYGKTKKKVTTSTTATVMCLCETKPPVPSMIDKYVETKYSNRNEVSKMYHLLPYECEPGICDPGECDPILCKQILDLRKGTRRPNKSTGSYTGSRRTKSTSSIVSRPFTLAKTKTVQSSIVPTKAGRTSAPKRYKDKLNLDREVFKTNINSDGRQAVRIGSSFSFNIEFYKDQRTAGAAIVKKPSLSSMTREIRNKQRTLKNDEYKENKKDNVSMFTQVGNADKNLRPSLKRCLCTLKLYKNKFSKNKTFKKVNELPAKIQTFNEVPIGENKSTKTKKEHYYKLLPFECEPYICVPGECDPHLCMQIIKRRDNTREVGAFTELPEMRSMSSLTENSLKKSEAVLVQPKMFQKGTNMKAKYVKVLDDKQRPTVETIMPINDKQAVRIESSFKFSVEFSKKLPGALMSTRHSQKNQLLKVHPKQDNKNITITKLHVDHVDTQVPYPKKNNRASQVRPILKRCFCTLNLQSKTKQQRRKDLGIHHFGPKVYTIGRAMTTKTELIAHNARSKLNANLDSVDPKYKMISISTSSFLLNKYVKTLTSKHGILQLYSALTIPIQLKQPIFIKSNLSMKVQLRSLKESGLCNIKQSLKPSSHDCMNVESQDCSKLFSQPYDQNFNKVTGLSRYLDRCFYTMNVQIPNPRISTDINKINNKLKPYECEPGICVPEECDPYECKKLIMKRLAKHVQKSSETNSTNKSVSSYAPSNKGLGSRSSQMQTHVRRHQQDTKPQKYKPKRLREQKQAVRIMSRFSFDLEFHKDRTRSFEKSNRPHETSISIKNPVSQKTYSTIGIDAQGKKIHRKDSKFQSTGDSLDKATAPGPMAKRCFCTLKLHKKGRIHNDRTKLNIVDTKEISRVTSRNVKVGTTTKYQKAPVDWNGLKFYECEPGICVPGQCDPYKCLELIKQRKDLGVNTIRKEKDSVTSTKSGKGKKKSKTRASDTIPVETHHKSIKSNKSIVNDNSNISSSGSRQAVRIGSNFSFNIEFFKDQPQQLRYKDTNLQRVKISKSNEAQLKKLKNIKASISKNVSPKVTEIERSFNGRSKKKTYTKRTENVHSIDVPDQHNNKTFKQKCFCLLGLRSKRSKIKIITEKQVLGRNKNANDQHIAQSDLQSKEKKDFIPTKTLDLRNKHHNKHKPARNNVNGHFSEKPVQTDKKTTLKNRHRLNSLYLEPYECEPGICIPDQCDPYFCEKIIQQRMAKQYLKVSDKVPAWSVSRSTGSYEKSKNEKTQAQFKTQQKHIQHTSNTIPPPSNKMPKNQIQLMSNSVTPSDKMTFDSDNRLVRIGSNFSFNIEFYKENVNGSRTKEKLEEVKNNSTQKVRNETSAKNNISKSIGSDIPKDLNMPSNEPHEKKRKTKTLGVSPLLKRCFCTLKIMNKPTGYIDQTKKVDQLDIKSIITTKSVKTQSNKRSKDRVLLQNDLPDVLSPYECEPNICIPGECNPVECLKLIQRRQQQTKDFGTTIKHPKKKSIGSDVIRTRDEKLQVKHLSVISNEGEYKTSYVDKSRPEPLYNKQKQAVRIGSNFSFNIEFFKDIGSGLPDVVSHGPTEELKTIKKSKMSSQHHKKSQQSYYKHSIDSQVLSTKLQATDTPQPQVKRHLYTLPLQHKNPIKLPVQSKSTHSKAENFLKKCMCTLKLNKIGKQQSQLPMPAVKYEIKGTSTRSHHIPQKGIKRPIKTLEPYECEPFVCVPGECDPYECLKLIQRRRVRDCGTDYKRFVKDFGTDSIKQPVTKSRKVQYDQKQKLNLKGTSLPSKCTRRTKETAQILSHPLHNTNRQVVRIGSNFSFNIEFFKDHLTANTDPKNDSDLKSQKNSKTLKTNSERKNDSESKAQTLTKIKTSQSKRLEKLRTKSKGSVPTAKRRSDKSSQFSSKRPMNPSTIIPPKRCFCTLKLLENPNHSNSDAKSLSPTITTKNKTTATKNKYTIPHELGVYECPPLMCIPGECNPYECLHKMKKTGVMRKSRNMGMRTERTSTASVGNRAPSLKVPKIQSKVTQKKKIASSLRSEPQSQTLKSPRVTVNLDRRDKRVVRIGSNFNFNVEFFKQKSQPAVFRFPKIVKAKDNEGNSKSFLNKNVTAESGKCYHNSQCDAIKLKDQALDAGNLLKRCFCTLQLQKPSRQEMKHMNMHGPGSNVKYPQKITVGRVTVETFRNTIGKKHPSNKTCKVRSTCIDSKLLYKTVGTKTDEKYIRDVEFTSSQCNPSNCLDYKKKVLEKKTIDDMQTILPYKPTKFNTKESKTCISDKNRLKNIYVPNQFKGKSNHIPSDTSMLSKGKRRLTAKKSKKSIPPNSLLTKSSMNDSFFCRCVKFFSRKSKVSDKVEEYMNNKRPNRSRSNRQSTKIQLVIPPKQTKQNSEYCPNICLENTNKTGKRNSKFQSRDIENSMKAYIKTDIITDTQSKYQGSKKSYSIQPQMKVTFADSSKNSKSVIHNRKTNASVHSKSSTRSRLCNSCSVNDCPLKSSKLKEDQQKSGNHVKSIKSNKKSVSYSESADDCQYCDCCKRKIDMDEISKAGGDRRLTTLSKYKRDAYTCGKETVKRDEENNSLREKSEKNLLREKSEKNSLREKLETDSRREKSKVDKLSQKYSVKQEKSSVKKKPLSEIKSERDISNKGKVKHTIEPLSNIDSQTEDTKSSGIKSKHDNLCSCCKCQKKREKQSAKLSVAKDPISVKSIFAKLCPAKKPVLTNIVKLVPAKPAKKTVPTNIVKLVPAKPPRKYPSPCICGSRICAVESKKKIRGKPQKVKPCVCGSRICKAESKRLKKRKAEIANKAKRKAASIKYQKDKKAVIKRAKIQEAKDKKHQLKRIKRNKKLEKGVKKYKDTGDLFLATDSLIDIGKLGASSLTGALRFTAKAAIDPKVTCERLRNICKKKDPETLAKQLQNDYLQSDAASTLRRLKTRCLLMDRVKTARERLEEYPVTHFFLHMADKNAKTRKFKRKPVRRVREPLDFECSLYMATLRKRPYLSVYYRCPWFYPHFITMLNIWKQFTDIMLFLLAVTVWSPCILCMEGCRALMCCFFCTG